MLGSFRLLKNNRSMLELMLSSTFINLLSLALPFTMLQIYDRILPNNSHGTATLLVSAVAIAILLELLLRYARSCLLASSASHFELETTSNIVNSLMQSDSKHIETLGSGKISIGLTSITTMRELYSGQAAVALMDFPFVIIFLALVAYIGGLLVFIPVAVWLVVGFLVLLISKNLARATQDLALSDAERTRLLLMALSGLNNIKSLGGESKLASRYNEINYQHLNHHQQVDRLSSKLQEWIQAASQGTTLLIVIIGCFSVLNGNLTTGGLAACSILAGRAIAPLSAIISLRARLASAQTAMSHVNELVSLPQEEFSGSHCYQQKIPLGPIEFEQVASHTVGAQLSAFDLTIPAGSLVSISSNPLTYSSLILSTLGAFHPLDSGAIRIAGIPQNEHHVDEYRQSIIYVPPWPTLFTGSLIENLTLYRSEYEPLAMELADELGLSHTLSQLPAGYQTQVGINDGQSLNKGAIKLIAIVRAIVQSPSILLLDEPFISLDADAQQRLLKLFVRYKGSMTIVAASHLAPYIAACDLNINIEQIAGKQRITVTEPLR